VYEGFQTILDLGFLISDIGQLKTHYSKLATNKKGVPDYRYTFLHNIKRLLPF